MKSKGLAERRIDDLVDQDPVRAYVLFYFGIRFYEYSEKTLADVCRDRGLNVQQVVEELEAVHKSQDETLPLSNYPIDLILEYLKHAHFLFVKNKLPYILKLVESLPQGDSHASVTKDLQTLFPLFVEDFIHHIYEEEDNLFHYIRLLDESAASGKQSPTLYYSMERNSLRRFAMEHEAHDDEMEGIRKITQDYHVDGRTPLHLKVIYAELEQLERSLKTHARIENEILFPKAMVLENRIRQQIADRIKFN